MNKYIENILRENNISQEELASLFDLSRPTVSKLLRGERDMTISEARKLADYLGISINDVINQKNAAEVVLCKRADKVIQKVSERISVPAENIEKFKAVLLYVTQKIGALPNVGQTVLYKILYFCDFDYYERFETQLIGARYIKNHFGPTPIEFAAIVNEMINNGEVAEVKSKYFNKDQTKYIPVVQPDLSVLSGQELEHIDSEIRRLGNKTATELSDFSHKDVPWIMTPEGEEIPYESVFYRTADTSVREYNGHVL